jgi:hypothetical protein
MLKLRVYGFRVRACAHIRAIGTHALRYSYSENEDGRRVSKDEEGRGRAIARPSESMGEHERERERERERESLRARRWRNLLRPWLFLGVPRNSVGVRLAARQRQSARVSTFSYWHANANFMKRES